MPSVSGSNHANKEFNDFARVSYNLYRMCNLKFDILSYGNLSQCPLDPCFW